MSRSTRKWGPVTAIAPASAVSEAYRSLRTNLEFSIRGKGLKTIMVASAMPGEGKSTTAANLAVAYARANRRVLLVDANLRSPVQHRMFGLANVNGLSGLLGGAGEFDQAIQPAAVDNLWVLCSGPIPPHPSELLDSAAMTALLRTAGERFDIVLVDTPPLLSVTDALVVAGKCDGVLLVVGAGKLKPDAAWKAKTSLANSKATVIGAVLNGAGR